ncbi:MAG TPA: hypothetical protein VLT90_10595 [Terriglobales bacterium]|nr:hypothetical protein [Terriglobales bacterium]
MKLFRALFVLSLTLALPGVIHFASGKEKEPSGQKVDSGSFGVFMQGRRVGTETFSITQTGSGSVIQSEFKTEGSTTEARQTAEMQLTATGDIRRYEWREQSPGKGQSTVVPNDQFLTQRWSSGPQEKPQEQVYLLPLATSILDDYFFVHREVLAWRYMASICSQQNGRMMCAGKQLAKFGTLNPRGHSSAPASLEYIGREKVTYKGAEQELNKLELKSESGTWTLWLDDQFKLVRILIPSENTEVIRD